MGMFMNRVALDETPDKAREMEQRLVDNMLKYREIQREVRDNPRIDILTQLLVMLAETIVALPVFKLAKPTEVRPVRALPVVDVAIDSNA